MLLERYYKGSGSVRLSDLERMRVPSHLDSTGVLY